MSPRWYDGQDHLALDTGGGPLARLWSTALSGLVDIGYVKATGISVQINLPKTALKPQVSFGVEDPGARLQHLGAQSSADLLPGLRGSLRDLLCGEGASGDPRRANQDLGEVRGAERGIGCGFTRRSAACSATTW